MRYKSIILVLLTIVTATLCSSSVVLGATLVVRLDGTGDFTTLSPAISAASEGDTILVGPGTHEVCHGYYLNKGLHIISEHGAPHTILYSRPSCYVSDEDFSTWGFSIGSITTSFTIQGFTLRNYNCGSYCMFGFAIRVNNSNGYIADNIIYDTGYQKFAIIIEGDSHIKIERNIIHDCYGAIWSESSDGVSIRHNAIIDNYWQVYITGEPYMTVLWYNIIANGSRIGIYSDATLMSHSIRCNDVWNNYVGNYGGLLPDLTGYDGNISADPLFCGIPGSGNYYLQGDSPCACGVVSEFCYLCPIGCLPVNCSIAVEENSWSDIKSLYK